MRMLRTHVALQGGHLHDVDVIDLVRFALEIRVLAGDRGDGIRKIPGAQNFLTDAGMDLVDHMVEAEGIRQQRAVLFCVGQDGQDADLVDKAGERRLVWHQAGVVAAEHMADRRDLGALVPDFAHLSVDHVGGGLEHLLHRQARGEVAGVVNAQTADGHLQVVDFSAAAQQRTVDHLDDARGNGGIVPDHLAQRGNADVGVFGSLAHAQRHFRQRRQDQFIVLDRKGQLTLDFLGKGAHVIPLCVGQCRLGASVCRLACRYGAPLW